MVLNVYKEKSESPHLIDGTTLNAYRGMVTLHAYSKKGGSKHLRL